MMAATSRLPGFEGLRLLAAGSVLFSHAFLVATGTEADEPFVRLLGPGNIIGLYGVFTFFIISGFLLARSLAHDPSVIHFGINRILRIYPGFIFCVLVTALVLGPIGSSLNWRQYFSNPETSGYITAAISCLCDAGILPDVYAYKGVKDVQTVVNGSLWSLSFEVLSYLLLAFMWVAFRNIKVLAIMLALLAAATIFPAIYRSIPGVTYTLPYFAGGVFMYVVYRRFGLSPGIVACCAALLIASSLFGLQHQAFAVFGAYIVVFSVRSQTSFRRWQCG